MLIMQQYGKQIKEQRRGKSYVLQGKTKLEINDVVNVFIFMCKLVHFKL